MSRPYHRLSPAPLTFSKSIIRRVTRSGKLGDTSVPSTSAIRTLWRKLPSSEYRTSSATDVHSAFSLAASALVPAHTASPSARRIGSSLRMSSDVEGITSDYPDRRRKIACRRCRGGYRRNVGGANDFCADRGVPWWAEKRNRRTRGGMDRCARAGGGGAWRARAGQGASR